MRRPSRPIFESRLKPVEWLMTAFMLGWALTLSIPGSTFSISSYHEFVKLGLTEDTVAMFFFIVGGVRACTLMLNGKMPYGAEIRFGCAAIGAFTWLFTGILFFQPLFSTGAALPVAASHHIIMFFAELFAIGVASFDRRRG